METLMKPAKTLFHASLLLLLMGSQPVFAVDSESLADELKKLKKTATAEQPVDPQPVDTHTVTTTTTLASGK